MLTSYYPMTIEWGACDAAAIAFYPNYLRWFDAASWRLFGKAGFFSGPLMREQGVYLPIADVQARFHRPGWLGDELVLESFVAEWHERFFRVAHRALRGNELILEGAELRFWGRVHPDDPRRMQALPIPAAFRRALQDEG